MSQQLRALTEPPEGLNLVLSTHVRGLPTAYNPGYLALFSGFCKHYTCMHMYTQAQAYACR